jgi:hypothetical protein
MTEERMIFKENCLKLFIISEMAKNNAVDAT